MTHDPEILHQVCSIISRVVYNHERIEPAGREILKAVSRVDAVITLAEALEPFARLAADNNNGDFSAMPRQVIIRCEATVGDILDARAALAKVGARLSAQRIGGSQ